MRPEGERAVLVILGNSRRERRYFKLGRLSLHPRDICIVETEWGEEWGEVIRGPEVIDPGRLGYPMQWIIRKASQEDREQIIANKSAEEEALQRARSIVKRLALPMKLVNAEYSFDRHHLTFYFTSPQRVDFRELLRELGRAFRTTIGLRQIGPREETQLKGGLGRCGLPICCARFLRNPESISMKMVYEQELFVPPERLTGLCGRLLCCLKYEHQNYVELLSKMPHLGSRIRFDGKEGKVVGHNIFRKTTIVELEDGRRVEVPGISKDDII